MLDSLSDSQKATVSKQAQEWLDGANDAGITAESSPEGPSKAFKALNLPCPFLMRLGTRGLCMAYESRPVACRMHVAVSPPAHCSHDSEREPVYLMAKQNEKVLSLIMMPMIEFSPDGKVITGLGEFGTLGFVLADALGLKPTKKLDGASV
jgi:Fe-S-cluster containining protein